MDNSYKFSYYAVFSDKGEPSGFYHESIAGPKQKLVLVFKDSGSITELPTAEWILEENPDCTIPEEAVKISDEEWQHWQDVLNPIEEE